MSVKEAYNSWSAQYDDNENKTRDLEAVSLKKTLNNIPFGNCLEIGCGTGKNTLWLATKASNVLGIDFSDKMLAIAKEKVQLPNVTFLQADITKEWAFASNKKFNIVSFSLVLEHIENLNDTFAKVDKVTDKGSYVYIGELHPFKQYSGSKARFETAEGLQVVTCFNHHVSDFTSAAAKYAFSVQIINEYFDNDDRHELPRILAMLFQKM